MDSNFVPLAVRLLHGGVVGVLVRNEEGGLDVTAVGILSVSVKDVLVQLDVVVVDGIIECDGDHLGNVFGWQVPRDRSAVLGAETVRQDTDRWVAGRSPVRVVVIIWTRQGELAGRGTSLKLHLVSFPFPCSIHRVFQNTLATVTNRHCLFRVIKT